VATTANVAVCPTVTAWLAGCVESAGATGGEPAGLLAFPETTPAQPARLRQSIAIDSAARKLKTRCVVPDVIGSTRYTVMRIFPSVSDALAVRFRKRARCYPYADLGYRVLGPYVTGQWAQKRPGVKAGKSLSRRARGVRGDSNEVYR
jgi:hypothetical protein